MATTVILVRYGGASQSLGTLRWNDGWVTRDRRGRILQPCAVRMVREGYGLCELERQRLWWRRWSATCGE